MVANYLSHLKSYIFKIWNLGYESQNLLLRTYFETKMSRFGLAGLPIVAIMKHMKYKVLRIFFQLEGHVCK